MRSSGTHQQSEKYNGGKHHVSPPLFLRLVEGELLRRGTTKWKEKGREGEKEVNRTGVEWC